LWRNFGHPRCNGWLSLLPHQDEITILLSLSTCWNSAPLHKCKRWVQSDISEGGHTRLVSWRCPGDGANRVWQLGAATNIFPCKETASEAPSYGRRPSTASYQ